MRLAIIFLLILSISFVHAELVPFISYSSEDATSHACLPPNPLCAYGNTLYIDSQYVSDQASGIRTLGVSGITNAHVEKGGQTNYIDHNLFMRSDIFSSNTCAYSNPGQSCTDIDSTYNCLFALSSTKNAHLSKCGVFGLNEIKFCCKFSEYLVIEDRPYVDPDLIYNDCGISFFEAKDIFVDENVLLSYSCDSAMDVNLMIFDSKGNPLSVEKELLCASMQGNFTSFKFDKPMNNAIARIYTEDCLKEAFFSVKERPSGTVIPDNSFVLVLLSFVLVSLIIFKYKKR